MLTLACQSLALLSVEYLIRLIKFCESFKLLSLLHMSAHRKQIFLDKRICSPPVRKVKFYTSESEKESYIIVYAVL